VTIAEWLRSRTPPAPEPLVARVEAALGGYRTADAERAPELLLGAAVGLLQPLLARKHAGRDAALDLLAADALVTYAFEAASADPEQLDARTREAMIRLAGLAPSDTEHLPGRE
jgi:hypothetical protein